MKLARSLSTSKQKKLKTRDYVVGSGVCGGGGGAFVSLRLSSSSCRQLSTRFRCSLRYRIFTIRGGCVHVNTVVRRSCHSHHRSINRPVWFHFLCLPPSPFPFRASSLDDNDDIKIKKTPHVGLLGLTVLKSTVWIEEIECQAGYKTNPLIGSLRFDDMAMRWEGGSGVVVGYIGRDIRRYSAMDIDVDFEKMVKKIGKAWSGRSV